MLFVLAILVFIICAFRVNRSFLPYLSADEMGPIAVAAHFRGYDWSQMTQFLSYYSYGYSLMLLPLMYLFDHPVTFYRAAIVVNCVLAACVVPFSYYFSKIINGNKSSVPQFVFSGLIALYPAAIMRANLALGELTLMVISWCLVILYAKLRCETSVPMFCLTGFLLAYIYLIHQRALGILLAGALILCLMLLSKHIYLKQFLAVAIPIALVFLAHSFIKPYVKEFVWLNGVRSDINDYGSIFERTIRLIAIENIPLFIRGVSGQLFYLGAASFLLAYVAVFRLFVTSRESIKSLLRTSKAKLARLVNDNDINWGALYMFAACLGTFAISAVFMGPIYNRADHLVYGRYNEIMLGPLMISSLIWLLNLEKPVIKKLLLCSCAFSVLGLLLSLSQGYALLNERHFQSFNSPMLFPFFENGNMDSILVFPVVFLGATVIFFLSRAKGYLIMKMSITACVCAYFIWIGHGILTENVFTQGDLLYGYMDIVEQTDNEFGQKPIFYYVSEQEAEEVAVIRSGVFPLLNTHPQYLQYLLWDKPLVTRSRDEMRHIESDAYVFAFSKLPFEVSNQLELVDTRAGMLLFQTSELFGAYSFKLPMSMFHGTKNEDGLAASNGEPGFFMYGPYISIEPGFYEWDVTLHLDLTNTIRIDDELGFIDVYFVGTNTKFYESSLYTSDFNSDGSHMLKIMTLLDEPIPQIELRAFSNEGVYMQVNSVSISKLLES